MLHVPHVGRRVCDRGDRVKNQCDGECFVCKYGDCVNNSCKAVNELEKNYRKQTKKEAHAKGED